MSAPVERTAHFAKFGGARRRFLLRIGEIEELEQICAAGVGAIFARVSAQAFKFSDMRETIRLGLIGGGMAPAEAEFLVGRYVDSRPVIENLQLAADVLAALMLGVQDAQGAQAEAHETPKKAKPESAAPATSPASSQPAP